QARRAGARRVASARERHLRPRVAGSGGLPGRPAARRLLVRLRARHDPEPRLDDRCLHVRPRSGLESGRSSGGALRPSGAGRRYRGQLCRSFTFVHRRARSSTTLAHLIRRSYTRGTLRPVDIHDVRFLRDLLRHAYHWRIPEDEERRVYRYVQNWGRRGDAGVVAMEGPHAYGEAWYRLFTETEPGFGFVDEETPEVSIAVVPSRRGKGAGKELLHALLDRARSEGYHAVSLS